MNILKTTSSPQELHLVPRKFIELVDLSIYDENKRTSTQMSVTSSIVNGYMVITESFSLEEGRFYTYRVKESEEVLYTGRIFCTDSVDLENFEMTENQYTSSNETDGVIFIN